MTLCQRCGRLLQETVDEHKNEVYMCPACGVTYTQFQMFNDEEEDTIRRSKDEESRICGFDCSE